LTDYSNLIHPAVNYNNWDADKIQGCVCDFGWEGYDCSKRSCPKGRNPSDPNSQYAKEETFYLQCQANSGYFSLLVMGHYTEPVPFDADPGYMKKALENLPNVGKVKIVISSSSFNLPQVCDPSSVVTTEIHFLDYFGKRPPLFVSRNSSKTRQWPSASQFLSLHGDEPILRFNTRYTLTCPSCHGCSGNVFFSYKSSISAAVPITSTNGTGLMKQAVLSLTDFKKSNWPDLSVSISHTGGSNRLCSPGVSTDFTIHLYSKIGNIEGLNLIDASTAAGNITLDNNMGNGTIFECSNQGVCDYSTGICNCGQLQLGGKFQFRAISSNGQQRVGTRGDCGFLDPPLTSCLISNLDACNGRGECSNITHQCTCFGDWTGLTCNFRSCPKVSFFRPLFPGS
jgi:hypothetical protein